MGHGHHHRPQLQQEHKSIDALGSSLGLDLTMAVAVTQSTQMGMVLMTARPLDTKIVSSSCLDLGHLLSPWWQLETWTSTQTLATAGL